MLKRFALLVSWMVATSACSEDAVVGTGFEPGTDSMPASTGTSSGSGTGTGGSTSPADTSQGTNGEGSMGSSEAGSSGVATGGACEVNSDCDDDNPCTYDFCGAGSCVNDAMDDVPSPTGQTEGDCRVLLCVRGESQDIAQDSDTPDDSNVCTGDLCEQGAPVHPDLPAGTECNREGVCDGAGACTECISPDDCDHLPVDDDCQQRTCEASVCGQVFSDAGTELGMQELGDCHVSVCDGAGGVDWNVDDTDVDDDGLECTVDVCTDGGVGHEPVLPGTPCEAGVCNEAGQCVGCLVPADCGGEDSFCRTITCDDGTCGTDDEPDGTVLPFGDQTDADCREVRCDGNGFPESAIDDDDLPVDDGNDCTDEVCNAGAPDHADLPVDTVCEEGVCDGSGDCVECNDDDQCEAPPVCQVAVCDDHQCTLEPAAAGTTCDDGLFCTTGDTCNGSGTCGGGTDPCVGPDGDSDCSETCDEAANACTGNDPVGASCNDGLFCTAQDACDGAGTCDGGGTPCPSVGDGDSDCNEACNEGTDTCNAPDPFGASCNDGQFCTTTDSCNGTGSCTGAGNPCGAQIGDGDNDCTENCNELTDACTAPDPNGVTCNDGLFCTLVDTCQNGVCSGGSSPCSAFVGDSDGDCSESCDESANSCTGNDPNGSSCNDNLFCTLSDFCTNGVCGGNGNPCAGSIGDADTDCSESCNETTNLCTNIDPNGSACNDGLHCNGADSCTGGVCSAHAGDPCAPRIGDADTDCSESCNEGSDSCVSNDPNGSSCNDGAFCNGADTCSGGVCSGHAGNPCPGPDNDNNCSESCNEVTNVCSANDPNNSVCNDGLFCTSNDRCNNSGVCVGGANPCDGPDGDTDCSEVCNETSNNCSTNDPNGVTCDHDCLVDGVCTNGACISACCIGGC